jgi:hypothetical protein
VRVDEYVREGLPYAYTNADADLCALRDAVCGVCCNTTCA